MEDEQPISVGKAAKALYERDQKSDEMWKTSPQAPANFVEGRQEAARQIVYNYARKHLDKTDKHVTFAIDEVFVVWFCKTLQNWKALLSTTLPDGMYYEVTFDGDSNKVYLDAYKKFDNVEIDTAYLAYRPA